MSGAFSRDIPKGAAAVIVALALLAGVVTGSERFTESNSSPVVKAPPAAVAAPLEELDLKRLARLRGEIEVLDLFAPPERPAPAVAPVPQPAAKPEAPAVPSAPPLPFTYLGRMKKGEQVTVYLLRNQELLLAQAGTTIDENYRVEGISDSAVLLFYVPLGTRQTLSIPAGQ